jgi:hypothetical protein
MNLKTFAIFVSSPSGEVDKVAEGLLAMSDAREALADELERTAYMEGSEAGLITATRDSFVALVDRPVYLAGFSHTIRAEA